jgi:hypothetical protein
MLLGLGATAIVAAVLLWELALPRVRSALARRARRRVPEPSYDPGRELRAEQRARELLRSCVNEEEWAMYRDLGFLRVWSPPGGAWAGDGVRRGEARGAAGDGAAREARASHGATEARYAYLLYPHKPIVAYVPQTGALLNEYCVAFPDHTRPYGSARLPDADDVLAKWMALTADERRLIADANMHLPGRQVDPEQVREDLERLARWEHERAERGLRGARAA